ncbi:hypothetical protein [Micromonospora sp. S-DT3-3-22]|uniref:hypothetical protein n=1 Tax=Micromonospora sp. S-DT3-3-22 TaxID=2755359 RepID=UPI00188E7828|nr:hypothetical protein [Micromonospora sp. S-DT3-3-22]
MNLDPTTRERVISAYADGQDAADIGRRYGLTRHDVEQIVAGDNTELAVAAALRKPAPAPVMAAVVVVALYGTVQLAAVTASPDYLFGLPFKLLALALGVLIYGSLAYGIWRGWRAAQWIGLLGGVLAVISAAVADQRDTLGILGGALLVALLVAPEQSREWFARR